MNLRDELVLAWANPTKGMRECGALQVARAVGPVRKDGGRLAQNGVLVLGTTIVVAAEEDAASAGDDECYLRVFKYEDVHRLLDDGWELA